MEMLIKAAAGALVGAVLALVIRRDNPEMALVLAMTIGCGILGIGYGLLSEAVELAGELAAFSQIDSAVVAAVLKSCAIAMLSKLTSDVCRDAGQSAAASAIETVGAAAAILTAGPMIRSVLEMIGSLT